MENKFYVYVHRRLDTGEIFYVGKGCRDRASSSTGRNPYWKSVVDKAGFESEILVKDLSESSAYSFEREMISLLRKLNVKLTNLSDGGEGGASGYKYEGEKLERLQKHIEDQWRKLADPNIYTFYHFSGGTFTGTRVEFSDKYSIRAGEVAKLFQSKNKRNTVKNWALTPFKDRARAKKPLVCPQRRTSNVDKNIYTFYHVLGDIFSGTRTEFSDYSQIELVKISSLFCKNPRRSVFGWSLNKLSPSEYTHLKI